MASSNELRYGSTLLAPGLLTTGVLLDLDPTWLHISSQQPSKLSFTSNSPASQTRVGNRQPGVRTIGWLATRVHNSDSPCNPQVHFSCASYSARAMSGPALEAAGEPSGGYWRGTGCGG